MHILKVLTSLLTVVSVKNACAATETCQDNLTSVAAVLAPGATFREHLLSNMSLPEVSKVMRLKRAEVKQENSVAQLGLGLRARVAHLDDPSVAGEFLFGLDIVGGLDPALYVGELTAALKSRAGRSARVLPALVGRGALIFVMEKFTLSQRVAYLRTLLGVEAASIEFMKVANAGQWLSATLTAPGLADILNAHDVELICGFANTLAAREIEALRAGRVDPTLAPEQWKLARALTANTQRLTAASACGAQLSRTMSSLDDLGRAHQFTP